MRKGSFYYLLEYGERTLCSRCGISVLTLHPEAPILCERCKRNIEKQERLNKSGVEIYNGKKVFPYLSGTEAAKAFEISEDRFRTLRNNGEIPGEWDRGKSTFWVDVVSLNERILSGVIQIYRRGKHSLLSDEEKQERKRQINRRYKASHREQANQYVSERKKNDPIFKLKSQARNTVYQSFARTGNVKRERCESITGMSQNDLITYLIGTYENAYGIPWDEKTPVQIDHIIPLATAQTEEDVIRLCHYSNLQLLKAEDHQRKGAKLDYQLEGA